jgi:hypothetical protein
MFWDFYTGQAIRMGDWKLWRNADTTVLFNIAKDPAELTNLAYQQPKRARQLAKKLDDWSAALLPSARYDPDGRGSTMVPALGGAPSSAKPDPRYQIPYDDPVATAYPAAVQSPGGPAVAETQPDPKSSPPAPAPAPAPAPKRRSQEQFFKKRDRNGDGVITLEEYIGDPKDRNVSALTKRFKQFDSNGDGKLSLEELKNAGG